MFLKFIMFNNNMLMCPLIKDKQNKQRSKLKGAPMPLKSCCEQCKNNVFK
jgi:hypothetical protein